MEREVGAVERGPHRGRVAHVGPNPDGTAIDRRARTLEVHRTDGMALGEQVQAQVYPDVS